MRFLIKNITGDPTNANPLLHEGVKLYACSDNLSNLSIIGPQETQSVSSKGYEELMATCPQFIQVLDNDGSPDIWAPFRAKVVIPANTWYLYDAGRMSGKWDLTNTGSTLVQFSFSGYTAPDPGPQAQFVSDLNANETIQFWSPMNPLRYVYLHSAAGATIEILVS